MTYLEMHDQIRKAIEEHYEQTKHRVVAVHIKWVDGRDVGRPDAWYFGGILLETEGPTT